MASEGIERKASGAVRCAGPELEADSEASEWRRREVPRRIMGGRDKRLVLGADAALLPDPISELRANFGQNERRRVLRSQGLTGPTLNIHADPDGERCFICKSERRRARTEIPCSPPRTIMMMYD